VTWPTALLGEVVDVLDSRRKPITKSDRRAGPYPYYGATGVVDWVDGFLFDEPLVLIGEDGAKWGAGDQSSFRIEGKTWVNNHAHVLRPRREIILDDWLVFFLNSADLSDYVSGMTVPKLNQGSLRQIEIPLPPLDEQKRIVAKLDQAFAALDRARANAEENVRDARDLFCAELQRQFCSAREDANLIPFELLCKPLTPTTKLKRQDYLEEGAYPVVSQEAELISGYWNDLSAVMGVEGPVVVFGDHTCCLKYVDFDFVVGADGTKVLQPLEGVAAKYLYYGLRSQPIQQTGYARHFKLLREISLPNLSIQEQRRITEHLDGMDVKCEKLTKAYEGKLADIAALRQSLLQVAFSGQLT
jgi:type I restriction enzyme, S subunit